MTVVRPIHKSLSADISSKSAISACYSRGLCDYTSALRLVAHNVPIGGMVAIQDY